LEWVCDRMEKALAPGAQTERRGDAGPVRLLLGGETHRPTFLLVWPTRALLFQMSRQFPSHLISCLAACRWVVSRATPALSRADWSLRTGGQAVRRPGRVGPCLAAESWPRAASCPHSLAARAARPRRISSGPGALRPACSECYSAANRRE